MSIPEIWKLISKPNRGYRQISDEEKYCNKAIENSNNYKNITICNFECRELITSKLQVSLYKIFENIKNIIKIFYKQ